MDPSILKEDQMDPSVKILVLGDKAVGENLSGFPIENCGRFLVFCRFFPFPDKTLWSVIWSARPSVRICPVSR